MASLCGNPDHRGDRSPSDICHHPRASFMNIGNNIGHPSLENNFKNEPVRTIKIN